MWVLQLQGSDHLQRLTLPHRLKLMVVPLMPCRFAFALGHALFWAAQQDD